jgi:hypothetical protein
VRAVEAEVSPNLGMVQLGGCSPEREKTAAALSKIRREGEASGGRRRRYGRGNGREGGGAREGSGAGSVSREWTSGRGRALSGSVGGAAERERKERGGPAAKVPHGAGRRRGAWPRPVGGALTVSRPVVTRLPRARAARHCSGNGALAPTGRAPVAARVGRPSPDEQ